MLSQVATHTRSAEYFILNILELKKLLTCGHNDVALNMKKIHSHFFAFGIQHKPLHVTSKGSEKVLKMR